MSLEKYLQIIKGRPNSYDNEIKIYNIEYLIEYKNSAGEKLTMRMLKLRHFNTISGHRNNYPMLLNKNSTTS